MSDTCCQCGGTPEEPGCDPVNGPRVPCCDPIHRIAYDVAHGARWITKEDS